MRIIYPAVFHKEDGAFWVEFPDLEGCSTFGDTVDETIANAKEALAAYYESLLENKMTVPSPSDISSITAGSDSFLSYVDCDITGYENDSRAVKKTLTIPFWLNKAASEKGINFSHTLQEALLHQISAM